MNNLNEILTRTLISLQDKKYIKKVVTENMYIEVYKLDENSEIGKVGTFLLKGFKDKDDKFATCYDFAKKDNAGAKINELFRKLKEKKDESV